MLKCNFETCFVNANINEYFYDVVDDNLIITCSSECQAHTLKRILCNAGVKRQRQNKGSPFRRCYLRMLFLVNRLVLMFSTSFLRSSSPIRNVLVLQKNVWLQLLQSIWYTQSVIRLSLILSFGCTSILLMF